ncbi:DNA independent RNA polymerase I transcription factor [Coemansia brasiliensis]|uniref:DNA independent RNA polymerase I transcription factor n=1 Tax=Coemansia brasiliensis TaxID=2650707 RepID=A0A9W8ICJ7_9FUNG|nr:DNA independent RNA polymerase I transcription factor [Coemansia brasiliensis]
MPATKATAVNHTAKAAMSQAASSETDLSQLTAMSAASSTSTDTTGVVNKQVFLRKFVENALQQVKEGSIDEYRKLVQVFAFNRYASPNTAAAEAKYAEDVAPWISALSENVSVLNITYRELVQTVLGSDWIVVTSDRLVHRYTTLVLQIVSAHPEWVPQAMHAMARWFSFGARGRDAAEAGRVHERAHVLVQEIYRAIPTCGSSLVAALSDAWPFKTAKTNMQVLFVRNALKIIEYAVGVRREVLRLVLNHIIQIDVEVQIELEDLESDSEHGDSDGGGVFELDEELSAGNGHDDGSDSEGSDSDSSDSDTDSIASDMGRARFNAKKTVGRLDALLSTLLAWLEQQCQPDPHTGELQETASRLFLLFLDLFGAVVLPTFKSRYTQFVVFYLCAKHPEYADVFLGTMVGNIGEPVRSAAQDRASSMAKVAAAAYLSSFVARAKFVAGSIVRNVVGVLVQWANAYLDWVEEQAAHSDSTSTGTSTSTSAGAGTGSTQRQRLRARTYSQALGGSTSAQAAPAQLQVDMERHAVFFAVTQAVLYMFCFRWRDLAQAQDGGPVVESELDDLRWCAELDGLQRVVFSRLNPLRACAPAVAQQFASVASQTNFMFCYAVLQQNRRSNIAEPAGASSAKSGLLTQPAAAAGSPEQQVLQARLDSFFPFDPMALPVSRQFIDSIYLEWQEVGDTASDEESDGVGIGNGGSPEDEAGMVEQIVGMSISPITPLSAFPGHSYGSQL